MAPELHDMSDQEILDTRDALRLAQLTALEVKRFSKYINGCPKRCTALVWQQRGVWAVLAVLTGLLLKIAFHV